jgi:PAS domain S-box-containing protein
MNTQNELDRFLYAEKEELTRLVQELQKSKTDLEARRYVETSVARFANIIRYQQEDSIQTWGDRILEELVQTVGGLQATLYILQEDDKQGYGEKMLQLVAAYAFDKKELQEKIPLGQSVIGQAAKSGRMRYFKDKSFRIRSYTSFADLEPNVLLIHPLTFNEQLLGMLELSAMEEFSAEQFDFIKILTESLAANLLTIRNQDQMKRLYEQTQLKAQELLVQEQEMRQNLEELESTQREMRRTSAELQKANLRFNMIIRTTGEGIFDIELADDHMLTDDLPIWWSDKLYELFGYAKHEIKPNVEFFYHALFAEDSARIKDVLDSFLEDAKQKLVDESVRVRRKNGELRWYQMKASALRNEKAKVIRLVGSFRDIDDDKRIQVQMEDKQNEFDRLIANVPGIVFQYSYDSAEGTHAYIYLSEQLEQLLGYSREQFMMPAAWEQSILPLHIEDEPRLMEALNLSVATMEPFLATFRVRHYDGHYVWFDANAKPRAVDHLVVWDGILLDINSQKSTRDEVDGAIKELRDFRAFIDGVMTHTPALFMAADHEGKIRYWNPAAADLLGYTESEAIGKLSLRDFHLFDELEAESIRISEALNRYVDPFQVWYIYPSLNQSYEHEYTFIAFSGEPIPVMLTASPWKDAAGNLTGVLIIARDIRREKIEHAQLMNLSKQMESAQALANVGSWELDLYTRLLRVTPQTLVIHGLTDWDDQLAVPFDLFVNAFHPTDKLKFLELYDQIMEGRSQHFECELRVMHPDETLRYVSIKAYISKAGDTISRVLLGTSQDVSLTKEKSLEVELKNEQLRAVEEELRQNLEEIESTQEEVKRAYQLAHEDEQRLRQIIDQAPIGIYTSNADGIIELANPSYCRITGYQNDELIGQLFTITLPVDDQETMLQKHRDCISGADNFAGQFQLKQKSGEYVDVMKNAIRIIGGEGQPKRLTFIFLLNDAQQSMGEMLQTAQLITEAPVVDPFLAQTFSKIPQGIIAFDLTGNIRQITDYAAFIHGYNPEELMNQPLVKLYHPENDDHKWQMFIDRAVESGQFELSLTHQRKNTSQFTASNSLIPIVDAKATVSGFVLTFRMM